MAAMAAASWSWPAGVDSLTALAHRKFWRAENGGRGEGSNRHGRSGQDLTILVPPGTVVIDAENLFVLKDLIQTANNSSPPAAARAARATRISSRPPIGRRASSPPAKGASAAG